MFQEKKNSFEQFVSKRYLVQYHHAAVRSLVRIKIGPKTIFPYRPAGTANKSQTHGRRRGEPESVPERQMLPTAGDGTVHQTATCLK